MYSDGGRIVRVQPWTQIVCADRRLRDVRVEDAGRADGVGEERGAPGAVPRQIRTSASEDARDRRRGDETVHPATVPVAAGGNNGCGRIVTALSRVRARAAP